MFTVPLQQLMALSENERQQRDQEGGRQYDHIDYGTANAAAGITMMPLFDLGALRAEKTPARPPLSQRVLALWHTLVGSRGLTHS